MATQLSTRDLAAERKRSCLSVLAEVRRDVESGKVDQVFVVYHEVGQARHGFCTSRDENLSETIGRLEDLKFALQLDSWDLLGRRDIPDVPEEPEVGE